MVGWAIGLSAFEDGEEFKEFGFGEHFKAVAAGDDLASDFLDGGLGGEACGVTEVDFVYEAGGKALGLAGEEAEIFCGVGGAYEIFSDEAGVEDDVVDGEVFG